jgi:Trk K+ transport system NAD-binding subunit
MLEDILPRADIELAEGDILVLLGGPADLSSTEKFLLTGR